MTRPIVPEERVQKAVVEHLRFRAAPGVYWQSTPNEGARTIAYGARLKAMGLRPGAPDLILIIGGRTHALELKTEAGRQSPEQRVVEREIVAAGGIYRLAKGIDEALSILTEWGAFGAGRAAA